MTHHKLAVVHHCQLLFPENLQISRAVHPVGQHDANNSEQNDSEQQDRTEFTRDAKHVGQGGAV